MVVANAVASLSEIVQSSDKVELKFTGRTVNTLLAALNECTEYAKKIIFSLLNALIDFI